MLCLLPKRLWRDNRTKKSTSLSPGLLWPDERAAQTPMIEWMKEEDDDDECRKEMAAAAVAVTTPPPPAAAISNDSRNKDREPLSGAEWRMCCKSMHREREGEEGRHNPTQPNPTQPNPVASSTRMFQHSPRCFRVKMCAQSSRNTSPPLLFFFFSVCVRVYNAPNPVLVWLLHNRLFRRSKSHFVCVYVKCMTSTLFSLSLYMDCVGKREGVEACPSCWCLRPLHE